MGITTNYYFKASGGILSRTGDPWEGKGDMWFRSAHFALFREDYQMLETTADHLSAPDRRRWPEALDDPRGYQYEHRRVGGMTRDPYIMFYAATFLLDRKQFIETVTPPCNIYRPSFNLWRNCLITGTQKDKEKYEKWASIGLRLTPNLPAFAVYLDCWMAWIAESERLQKQLRPFVPGWNLCQRQLINHPLKHLDQDMIHNFLPGKGMPWQWREWKKRELLPLNEEYYLDRESLVYVYNQNLIKDK